MSTGYSYDSNFKFSGTVSLRANRPIPHGVVLASPFPIISGQDAFYIAGEWKYYAPGTTFAEAISVQTRFDLTPGEVIDLLDDPSGSSHTNYAKIFRAAYPKGSAQEDDIALYFLEKINADGGVDVKVQYVSDSLDHFITQNYIAQADKARVLGGITV